MQKWALKKSYVGLYDLHVCHSYTAQVTVAQVQ